MKSYLKYWIGIFITIMSANLFAQNYAPEKVNPLIKIKPVIPIEAYAFNLKDVRINGGIFAEAMKLDAGYLLSLKPDRFLYRFRLNAGLQPKDSIYGGWEEQGVSGHSFGHYLSACAMMYAASGDAEFKRRTDYMVNEIALCQQQRKTGYVGGIPNEDSIFAQVKRRDIRSQGFDLNGGWVPWYTIHKVLAGLEDAYLYCDNKKALLVLEKFAVWIDNTTKNFTDADWQKMLAAEHGGMNEVLANLYSYTGNKMYLSLSRKFYHKAVLDALAEQKDELAGKHANTQIPKIIGMARLYELTASNSDKTIADFFWNTVVYHHSYVIGGNSNNEHFSAADKLTDHLGTNTTETCNTYNMLKLTRHLFGWKPDAVYMDYYERALYNHILASQNHETGMMCYYVPLQAGTSKQFNTPFESFWCCTGTGMENHVKYGEQIYSEGKDGSLYVNLFIPSTLNWKAKNIQLQQQTEYPKSDKVSFVIHAFKNSAFTMHIRRPAWATQAVTLTINGKIFPVNAAAGSWVDINRTWTNGDKIEWQMPMNLYTEAMPDNADRLAFLYGPLVLAGKLPAKSSDALYDVPVLVADKNSLSDKIEQKDGLFFSTAQISQPYDVFLVPFYQIEGERQQVYFDVFSGEKWQQYKASFEEENKRKAAIEARTVDILRIGEMQPERDHNLIGENTNTGSIGETKWRDATNGGYFSFDMKIAADNIPYLLQLTYWGSDGAGRDFDILVDGKIIATESLNAASPNKFIDKEYAIPQALLTNKTSINIKIQAHAGKTAGGVFGCRILKAS